MGRMKRRVIGKMTVGPNDTITVTDPCYNADVLCRMDDLKVRNGDYTAIAWLHEGLYEWTDVNGERKTKVDISVGTLGIYLNGVVPGQDNMKEIGEIGVDAGLCGIFTKKPDYADEQWSEFCDLMHHASYRLMHNELGTYGVVSSSGYGDGGYPVLACKDAKGEIIALEVNFI